MTNPNPEQLERLRIRVGELSGYSRIQGSDFGLLTPCGIRIYQAVTYKEAMLIQLPNYPEDLNACHEAEKMLTEKQRCKFTVKLDVICADSFHEHKSHWSPSSCFAEAWQRCLALDRTLSEHPIL